MLQYEICANLATNCTCCVKSICAICVLNKDDYLGNWFWLLSVAPVATNIMSEYLLYPYLAQCLIHNTHMLKPSGDKKHATALPSTRIEEKLNIISQFSGIANLSFVFPFSWFLWISIKFQSHLFAVYGYLASEPVLRRHLFHIQPGCRQKSSPFMNRSHHPHPTTTKDQRGCGVGGCCVGSPLANDHCPWTSPNLKSND